MINIARGGETWVVRMSTQIDTAPVGLGSYTVGPHTHAIEEWVAHQSDPWY